MKKGDWVRINFLGKIKSTGEVFDLTREEDAKENGIFDEKKKYGPVLIIIGGGMIIPGVEKELMGMEVGENRSFDVKPQEALGPRRVELIRVIPAAKFVQKNINPFPGMWVNVDGRSCKIQSVSAGRIRVDFNHPLAGKELSYSIEIADEITDAKKRVESLADYYGVNGHVAITEKKATITVDKEVNPIIRKLIEETLKKWCPGIEAVEFPVKAHKKEEDGAEGKKHESAEPAEKRPAKKKI